MDCKLCGESMEYQGIDDGGGDYGNSICNQWYCPICDFADENGCVEYEDEQLFYPRDGVEGVVGLSDADMGVPVEDDTQPLTDLTDIPF